MQSQWPSTVRSRTWEAKCGGTANRRYHLHAFVGGGNPPTYRAAPGNAGDPQACAVYFRHRRQQVETAHAVPELYTGGRVALAEPVEPAAMARTVMVPLDFTKLDGLDEQAGKAELGELAGMGLIVFLLLLRVTADIEHARHGILCIRGQVEVAGDVESGQALVIEI